MPDLKAPGFGFRALGGPVRAAGPMIASLLDADEAYLDFDSASIGYARFGVKRNGAGTSGGVKIRTLNAGAAVDALIFGANGSPQFIGDIKLGLNSVLRDSTGSAIVYRDDTSLFIAVGSGNAADYLKVYAGAVERLRVTTTGALLLGTTVVAGAGAGDLVLANAKALRGVNTAGTNTRQLIRLDANEIVQLGEPAAGYWVSWAPVANGTLPAGSAAMNGVVQIDSTNNRIVYYVGGARYYMPAGTSF